MGRAARIIIASTVRRLGSPNGSDEALLSTPASDPRFVTHRRGSAASAIDTSLKSPSRSKLRQSVTIGNNAVTAMESAKLRFGDTIALRSGDGYVKPESVFGGLCLHKVPAAGRNRAFNDSSCVFRIVPRQMYTAQKLLRKGIESIPDKDVRVTTRINELTRLEPKASTALLERTFSNALNGMTLDSEMSELKTRAQAELQSNATEITRRLGEDCMYGQIFQLQHVVTGLFLSIDARQRAITEPANMKVQLTDGSDTSWFALLPGHKIRAEGQPLFPQDQVQLLSVKLNQSLHLSETPLFPETGALEINCSPTSSLFTVVPFSYHDSTLEHFVQGGDIVTFKNGESDTLLSVDLLNGPPRVLFQLPSERKEVYSNSYWQVESHELLRGGSAVTWGQLYRIKHVATGLYLRVRNSEPPELGLVEHFEPMTCLFAFEPLRENPSEPGPQDRTLTQLRQSSYFLQPEDLKRKTLEFHRPQLVSDSSDSSAMMVSLVPPADVRRLIAVSNKRSQLNVSLQKFLEFDISRPVLTQVIEVLRKLSSTVVMIEGSDDETFPDRAIQDVYLDQGILDVTFQIVETVFAPRSPVKVADLRTSQFDALRTLIGQAYTLLHHCIVKNNYNAVHASRFVSFLMQRLGEGLNESLVIRALVAENDRVLAEITEQHIMTWIDTLKTTRTDDHADRLQFLGYLCVQHDRPYSPNQVLVTKMLIEQSSEILAHLYIEESALIVDIPSEQHKEAMPLFSRKKLFPFVAAQLSLVAVLCQGRNSHCIERIRQFVSYEALEFIACNDTEPFPWSLRCSAVEAIYSCYIDVDPYQAGSSDSVEYFRDVKSSGDRLPWPGIEACFPADRVNDFARFQRFKRMIITLPQTYRDRSSILETDFFAFVGKVCSCMEKLLHYGGFSSQELTGANVTLLWWLGLDPLHLNAGSAYGNVLRRTKGAVVRLISDVHRYHVQYKSGLLLAKFKAAVTASRSLPHDPDERLAANSRWNVWREVDVTDMAPNIAEDTKTCRSLLSLTTADDAALSSEAFRVFFDFHSQNETLFQVAARKVLLVSNKNIKWHQQFSMWTSRLRTLHDDLPRSSFIEMADLLGKMGNVMRDEQNMPNRSMQLMVQYSDIDKMVIRMLRSWHDRTERPAGFAEAADNALRFLALFTVYDPDIQDRLFPDFEFFHKLADARDNAVDLMTEIVRNNRGIAMQLKQHHLQKVASLITRRGLQPRYLYFLQAAVVVDDVPLLKSQELVAELLLNRPETLFLCLNDPFQRRQRDELLAKHPNYDHDILQYHLELLKLLAMLCIGKNLSVQARVQALLPISTITPEIQSLRNFKLLRRYLMFVTKGHFADRVSDLQLADMEPLLEVFRNELLKAQLLLVEIGDMDDLGEYHDRVRFSLDAMVPCLSRFVDRLSARQATGLPGSFMVPQIVESLVRLHDAPALAKLPAAKRAVVTCLTKMRLRGLTDEGRQTETIDQAQNTEYLIHSPRGSINFSQEVVLNDNWQAFLSSQRNNEFWAHSASSPIALLTDGSGTYVQRLVMSLQPSIVSDAQTRFIRNGLRVLLNLINNQDKWATMLVQCGTAETLLRLIMSNDDVLIRESLEVATAFLENGPTVQLSFLNAFREQENENVFFKLRGHLMDSTQQIKYEKRRLKMMRDSLAKSRLRRQDAEFFSRSKLVAKEARPASDYSANVAESDSKLAIGILLFLQQLCEGHNNMLQTYLRFQTDRAKSINMVLETATYLQVVERLVSSMLDARSRVVNEKFFRLLLQTVRTLTEFAQGCPENMRALATSTVFDSVTSIMKNIRGLHVTNEHEMLFVEVKSNSLVLTLSLLEGGHDLESAERLVSVLDAQFLRVLTDEMNADHQEALARRDHVLTIGFNAFALLRTLLDFHGLSASTRRQILSELEKSPSFPYYEARIGSIEISRDEELEKVYFPIPLQCQTSWRSAAIERAKDALLDGVDRQSRVHKLQDFISAGRQLLFEAGHLHDLNSNRFARFSLRTETGRRTLTLLFAIAINVLCIGWYTAPAMDATTAALDFIPLPTIPDELLFATYALGGVVTFLTLYSWVMLLVRQVPVMRYRSRKAMEKGQRKKFKPAIDSRQRRFIARSKRRWARIKPFLTSSNLYTLMLFVFSVLGLAISPLFFAFHLAEFVARSSLLQYVLRAVTKSGSQLLQTLMMIVLLNYVYSIFGFVFFRNQVIVNDVFQCDTMFMCFFTFINYGIRSDTGIGSSMAAPRPVTVTDGFPFTLGLFQVSHFILMVLIAVAIVSAIIIDQFASMRDAKSFVQQDNRARCFICNLERQVFDRVGSGFERHILHDHNMWLYLFFLEHLRTKEVSEYTAQESYVHTQVKQKSILYFPTNRAIEIDRTGTEQADPMHDLLETLDDKVDMVLRSQRRSSEVNKPLGSGWSRLRRTLEQGPNALAHAASGASSSSPLSPRTSAVSPILL